MTPEHKHVWRLDRYHFTFGRTTIGVFHERTCIECGQPSRLYIPQELPSVDAPRRLPEPPEPVQGRSLRQKPRHRPPRKELNFVAHAP